MTKKRKGVRRLESNARQARGHVKNPATILADYERGTCWAALLLVGMFAFMSIGSVMFGW